MKRICYALLATPLAASPALAHDPKLHKGPKVSGKVVSIQGDRLEVGTDSGPVAVTLTPETSYESGADGGKATKAALKVGQTVMVSGHKLESGAVAASEVMIHGSDESNPHSHADGNE
ncbi:MAG: hypothetical protein J0H57_07600 [Rhodospirillales bacterium]|nr:hypothetical protein [Rhodospirillales bacterium]